MKVAFIGVGTMGKPMAANIVKAGHQVSVFDASLDTTTEVAAEIGAAVMTDLSGTVDCEFIVTMLPDGHVVRAVALGEGGVGSWARAGTIFIDMSSSQPLVTQSTGAELAKRDIVLIDAPVSGGLPRAVAGTLTIMVGSDDPGVSARARPLLECMGKTFFNVGKLGSGHAAKALNNVVAASNYAILAEAALLGERYGIDLETMVDIVNVSTGQSFCSTVVMKQFVVPKTFNTGFQTGLLAKDAQIADDLSTGLGYDAPVIHLAAKRWAQARDALGSGADMSKALLAWR